MPRFVLKGPMSDSSLELLSLLVSRLCHDLASPVGAVANGAELLADERDPAMRAQAIDLIALSANEATKRLAFFRLAFGSAGGLGDTLPSAEIRALADGFVVKNRMKTVWVLGNERIGKDRARVALNLVALAATCLPRGGELAADLSGPGFSVVAKGAPVVVPAGLAAVLAGGAGLPDGLAAHAALTVALAKSAGGRLSLSHSDIEARLDFVAG
jgi:histidine phosphotransferase ChpT